MDLLLLPLLLLMGFLHHLLPAGCMLLTMMMIVSLFFLESPVRPSPRLLILGN